LVGILLYLAASAAAFAIGAQLLRSLKLLPEDRALRALVAVVTGYVAVALLILALGLLGKLQWWALTDLLILCALAGLREIQDGVLTAVAFTRKAARALGSSPWRWVYGVLALIVLAQLFAALAPAGGTDYDGIAEHLAQAKEYARAGRIHPLWYDHHSQFPATVEMWYTLAHVLGQPRGAKLFHWGFGVIALLATMLAGRRLLGPGAGAYGALALATTPNFAWLMGVAYVDLATVACSVLAVYAFCRWLRRVDAEGMRSVGEEEGDTASRAGKPDLRTAGLVGGESSAGEAVQGRKNAYLWLSALMVGAAAGTKMQGLALMGVLVVGVLLSGGIRAWRRGRTASRAGKPDLRAASIAGGQSSAGEEAADKASRAGKPDLRTAGLAGSRSWAGEDTQDHDAEGKPSAGEQGADTASRARTADLRAAVLGSLAYLAIALAVCWPWYVKSYLWTGNPVYPFAYNIFGGKMWSADRAAGYRRSQLEFGMGELPSEQALQRMSPLRRRFCGPRSPLNLLLAPVNLTLHPTEFTVPLTPFGVCAMSSIGPLYLALLPLLLVVKRRRAIGWLLLIFAPLWAWWLMSMQLTRYLLPSLALICPAVGWAVAEAERKGGLLGAVTRAATGVWAAVALALIMLYVLPQTPVALGLQSEYGYLMQTLPVYQPCVYINRHTPEDAKIALYGEPRGYYLDRDYLWAERGHSALIRYEDVRTPEDLMSEYRRLGITHLMINMGQFADLWRSDDRLALLIGQAIDEGLLELFAEKPGPRAPYLLLRVRGNDTRS